MYKSNNCTRITWMKHKIYSISVWDHCNVCSIFSPDCRQLLFWYWKPIILSYAAASILHLNRNISKFWDMKHSNGSFKGLVYLNHSNIYTWKIKKKRNVSCSELKIINMISVMLVHSTSLYRYWNTYTANLYLMHNVFF